MAEYKQIYKEKNKRYLFWPNMSWDKKNRKQFNDQIDVKNLETMLQRDIDNLSRELWLWKTKKWEKNTYSLWWEEWFCDFTDFSEKEIKEILWTKVRDLYLHFMFTRNLSYLEKLSSHTIPPIVWALKQYKKYFMNGTDFPDLIQYVIYNITEEFKCLKWSVWKWSFMTFIYPRVKKFVQEFLESYQRENEEMARTYMDEEHNYAIITEKTSPKWRDKDDTEITEHIVSMNITLEDPNEIKQPEINKMFKKMSILIEDNKIKDMHIEWKFIVNTSYFINKFKNIINNSWVLIEFKNKKSEVTEEDLKDTFIFLLQNWILEDKEDKEILNKIDKIILWVKKIKYEERF